MTLPETTPQGQPVLGYAGADAIQLDLRALARIRLGNGLLIAYVASVPIRLILNPITSFADAIYSATFAYCLVAAACLLAANTRLPSDRPVIRRLLIAAAIALAVAAAIYTPAIYFARRALWAGSPSLRVFTIISPFSTTAYGMVLFLCFFRLSDLSRRFHARAIAIQSVVTAVIFLALHAVYLSYGILAAHIASNSFSALLWILTLFRCALCLWAAVFLACLLPRLKPTSSWRL